MEVFLQHFEITQSDDHLVPGWKLEEFIKNKLSGSKQIKMLLEKHGTDNYPGCIENGKWKKKKTRALNKEGVRSVNPISCSVTVPA